MSANSSLLKRLEKREKIHVTPSHYLRKWNLFFLFLTFFAIILDVLIIYKIGKSFLTVGLVLVVTFTPLLAIYYLRKHVSAAYMRGDTLIFKSFDNSSKVTSLRSVRKVKSKKLLGFKCIRLEYNLDGMYNSVIILNSPTSRASSADKLLADAIDWSKKRKANHKPGPVAV